MRERWETDENTRRELAELQSSMVDVDGIRITRVALDLLRKTGTDPGELAARCVLDCTSSAMVDLLGYELDSGRRPRDVGFAHVVLDPERMRITIYEEFC